MRRPALGAVIRAALIKNVDEKGRVPFVLEIPCKNIAGVCFGHAMPIPAQRRFVVEFIKAKPPVAPR